MTATPIPTHRSAPTRPGRTAARRLLLLVVAVLAFGSSLALGARPAAAAPPVAPTVLPPVGWDQQALVAWSQFTTPVEPITSYRVERYVGNAALPDKLFGLGAHNMWIIDQGLTNGTTYRYRIQAVNADGPSAWSAKWSVTPKAGKTDTAPFASTGAFVKRQYQDFLGRAPSGAELSAAVADLDGNGRAYQLIDDLASAPARVAERHPVIRLYFAFFERSPDVAGANHWIAKRKAGTNLNAIASSFAGSNEFKTTYGPLSNAKFVEQVYLNVFDRYPDPAGLDYWKNKLDHGTTTRGKVMVGFSESTEYAGTEDDHGLSTGRVQAADLWMAVMKTLPSNDTLVKSYAPHIQRYGNQGALAMVLLDSAGYPK